MKISKSDFLLIPNIMSMFRIVLIPLFIWIYLSDISVFYAFAVLALSWITDILDGYVARHFDQISELGKILDPLADKLTQAAILLVLWMQDLVPLFIVLILLAKELLMLLGALFIKGIIKGSIIPSNYWGKSATGCFYISAGLIILKIPHAIYGIYITVVLMIIAFITYSIQLKKLIQNNEEAIKRTIEE